MLDTLDITEAHILTAKLLYANLLRVLNDMLSSSDQILKAVMPFFVLQFTRKMITSLDSYKFKVLLSRIERSPLPLQWYDSLTKHINVAYADDSMAIPFGFEEWRRLSVRFQLDEVLAYPDWLPLLNHLVAYEIRPPSDLASVSRVDICAIVLNCPLKDCLLKLWQASSQFVAGMPGSGASPAHDVAWCTNAVALADSFRYKSIEDSGIALSQGCASAAMSLPPNFSEMGPAKKIRLLKRAAPDKELLLAYLNTGSQINILRQAQCSLRSVAAGIQ